MVTSPRDRGRPRPMHYAWASGLRLTPVPTPRRWCRWARLVSQYWQSTWSGWSGEEPMMQPPCLCQQKPAHTKVHHQQGWKLDSHSDSSHYGMEWEFIGLADNPWPRWGIKLWTVSVVHHHITTLRYKSIHKTVDTWIQQAFLLGSTVHENIPVNCEVVWSVNKQPHIFLSHYVLFQYFYKNEYLTNVNVSFERALGMMVECTSKHE